MGEKYEEDPRIVVNGTENTIWTTVDKTLHRVILSTTVTFLKSAKQVMTPNKHKSSGPSGRYVSASEKARKQVEVIMEESKQKVEKNEYLDDDSTFQSLDKWDGKPVCVVCGHA